LEKHNKKNVTHKQVIMLDPITNTPIRFTAINKQFPQEQNIKLNFSNVRKKIDQLKKKPKQVPAKKKKIVRARKPKKG
jgi:hypothetical protein